MKTNALMDEIIFLPMEERARMAKALLQSLNRQDDAINAASRLTDCPVVMGVNGCSIGIHDLFEYRSDKSGNPQSRRPNR